MFYENVKKIADEKGISIYKLEKDTGLSHGSIRKWKNSVPSVSNIQRVAKVLDVKVDELII